MKITDILKKECIIPELMAKNKRQVLEELADALVGSLPAGRVEQDTLVEVLCEREKLGSTGIGDGIAIPHGKIFGLDEPAISFGRSTEGVDFDSMDDRPTHLFFLLVTPENSAGTHLRILARIARLLKSDAFRKKLLDAVTTDEIFEIITKEES